MTTNPRLPHPAPFSFRRHELAALRGERPLWQLAAALFDPLPADTFGATATAPKRRRIDAVCRGQALTQWLKETSQEALDREKRSLDTPPQRMFSLLTAHRIAEACALAVAYKDLRLATLVRFECV